jgi:predicted TIM-barrel fold metal-dependent hydrolase
MTATIPDIHDSRSAIEGIKVIDTDTHLTEPADLWTSRAPKAFKDRVPRVVMRKGTYNLASGEALSEAGESPVWVVDDSLILGPACAYGVVNAANEKVRGIDFMDWSINDISPAASFLEPRLAAMDATGIWGQIVYPNLAGFGGQAFSSIEDLRLRNLCATLYNDAMAEIQEQSGGRIMGMGLLPWWDVPSAIAEVERIHTLGLKGVNTNADPQDQGLPDLGDPCWEPLWEACTSHDLPVNFHIGASLTQASWYGKASWPSLDNERKLALGSTLLYLNNARVIGNLIFSGVLERHPTLKIVSSESGVGWIPFALDALDYQVTETAPNALDALSMNPSEYFRRQIFACFWFEGEGLLDSVRRLGFDNCMFETDFPHPTCLFPDPLTRMAGVLEEVDYGLRKKLLSGNAARVYNIDVPT